MEGVMKKVFFTVIAYLALGGAAMAMEVVSSSIENGALKTESACKKMGGKDISPALKISNLPRGTQYLAIIMDDPDAQAVVNKTYVHWNVLNLPKSSTNLAAGAVIKENILENSAGEKKYAGMCPPNGRHTYRIAVFALKDKLDASKAKELTIEQMEKDYSDKIIEKAVINGAWG
jgi:Raf kinase inhibitor-like YbhB/YbcL family protein